MSLKPPDSTTDVIDTFALAQTELGYSQQTTDYQLVASDRGKIVEINATTSKNVTIPLDSTTNYSTGTFFEISRFGLGEVLIQPEVSNRFINPRGIALSQYQARNNFTIAQNDAAGVYTGSGGVRCTSTGAGDGGVFIGGSDSLATMGLKVGDRVSARLNISTALTGGTLWFRFRAGLVTLSQVQGTTVTSGVTTIQNALIPDGCDNFLLFTTSTAVGVGNTVDVDGAMIVKGATAPTSYNDAITTPGVSWLGTAHLSQTQGPIVHSTNNTIPQYGRVRVIKRADNEWIIDDGTLDEILLDSDTLTNDRDNGQLGMYTPYCPMATRSNAPLVSNRIYLCRFEPSRAITATSISFRVGTASGTNDPVETGIYDASGVRMATSGSVLGKLNAGTVTKNVPFTAGTLLTAGGVYYSYLVATSTASLEHITFPGDLAGVAMPMAEMMTKAAVVPGSTPNPITGHAVADTAPLLFVNG